MNNSMNDLMNLISVLCGGYCLYTWFRLVREKRLFENGILLPKDRKPEDCFDEGAYIRIIRPKLGILGLVIFLFGVFSAINDRCDPPILEFPLIFIPWGVEAARADLVRREQLARDEGLFLKVNGNVPPVKKLAGGIFCVIAVVKRDLV